VSGIVAFPVVAALVTPAPLAVDREAARAALEPAARAVRPAWGLPVVAGGAAGAAAGGGDELSHASGEFHEKATGWCNRD
jgi:hypothetical protein